MASFAGKQETNEQLPLVVVGGGLAGLAAALAAAKEGEPVLLLEGADQLGGLARTRDLGGYRFNLGARALYVRGAGCRALEELGVNIPGRKPSLRGAGAMIGGELSILPMDLWTLLRCSWLGARGRVEAAGFFASLPKLDPETAAGMSAEQWLGRRFRSSKARSLFEAFLRLSTYCGDLDALSAPAALAQLQRSADSVLYVDGGWQTLVDGLVRRLKDLGGCIETGCKVTALKTREEGTVEVQIADGRRLRAASAVAAVSPSAAGRLVHGFTPSPEGRPVRAACLDVALSSLPEAERLFVLGIDRPYYFSVHSATAELAPADGGEVLHLLRYGREGETWTREALLKEMEATLDSLQPGWRELELHRQFLPNMTVSHDVPGPGRSLAPQILDDGIFAAGDWVEGEGLLADAALASGLRAAAAARSRRAGRRAA